MRGRFGTVLVPFRSFNHLYSVDRQLAALRNIRARLTEEGRFLNSPKLQREDKKRVLDAVFAEHVSRPVMGLLHVLVDKRREPVFDNIVAEFAKYRDEHEGRAHATVTTAQPLPDDEKARLVAALAKQTGKQVDLHEKINPAVIGGIRVNLGDYVLDGTVRRRLNELRRSFAAEQG